MWIADSKPYSAVYETGRRNLCGGLHQNICNVYLAAHVVNHAAHVVDLAAHVASGFKLEQKQEVHTDRPQNLAIESNAFSKHRFGTIKLHIK